MAAYQSLTAGELSQAAILDRDVVETFSKLYYFSGKYTFQIICHKIGFAIVQI